VTHPSVLQRPTRAVTIIAVAALVAGPPLNYLRYNRYPLLTPEVLLLTALALACSFGIGSMLNRASRPVRIGAFSFLALVAVDWLLGNSKSFTSVITPGWLLALVFFAGLVALVACVWLLERHVETILAVTLAAFYVAALPTSSAYKWNRQEVPKLRHNVSLPPVLYLVLDEHIGVEGWPTELASARATQARIRQFYLDRGFRLFGRAYSEFFWTHASIPTVLNWPVQDPRQVVDDVVPWWHYRVKVNELFGKLSSEGYRIRVYQSTYVDYCRTQTHAIQSCETYPLFAVSNIALLDLPVWSKATLVGIYFLENNSRFYRRLMSVYSALTGPKKSTGHLVRPTWDWHEDQSAFPDAMAALEHLQADLRADDSRGTLYFAHLIAPHHPFVADSSCRTQPLSAIRLDHFGDRSPEERAHLYDLYAAQAGCLYRRLEALFRMIDSISGGQQMVVIVHGDHGSRLGLHDPTPSRLEELQPSDFTDAFSALFAIRAPGIPPGYDQRFVPINELVGRALEAGFARIDVPETEAHVVKLDSMKAGSPLLTLRLSDTALALPRGAAGATQKRPR